MVKRLKTAIRIIISTEILLTVLLCATWGVNNDINGRNFIAWVISLGVSMVIGFTLWAIADSKRVNNVK